MSTPPLTSTGPALASAHAKDHLRPQLHRRSSAYGPLGESAFLSSTAAIALSHELHAVITVDGAPQSPADLGRVGLSIRGAWDEAADNLLRLARTAEGLRVWLRPVTDSWFEVAVDGAAASSWLAHPKTFTVLNNHLGEILRAPVYYRVPGVQAHTLFVTATRTHLAALDTPEESFDVVYSAGFPVPAGPTDFAVDHRTSASLPVAI